jgi:serine/threonine protein kinase
MLCRTDGTVLLSDFGIASVAHASSSVNAFQSFGGTLPYMAPEQHMGKPRPASDQYALAMVVYEWLAGTRPFQGTLPELVSQHLHAPPPSLRYQVPMLPATVEEIVLKALAKEPQDRFPCVQDFAIALQAAYPQHVIPSLTVPSSSQRPASLESHQPVSDQATQPAQTKGDISPPTTPPVLPPPPKANQTASMESLAVTPSLSSITVSAEVPTSPVPLTLAAVSRPSQHRGVLNRRMLFTLLLVLLVVLSGGSLYYFGFIAQRTPTLSPAQAKAATATAAAQAYVAATAKQGAMFGFDAAHTHNNPYENTLSPGNVSRLKPLWSFPTGDIIHSSPAAAGGMVYVSSADHKLYAFDASCRNTCKPLWSFPTGAEIWWSSPAVADGMVYVGSADHKLYAFGLVT